MAWLWVIALVVAWLTTWLICLKFEYVIEGKLVTSSVVGLGLMSFLLPIAWLMLAFNLKLYQEHAGRMKRKPMDWTWLEDLLAPGQDR